MLREHTKYFKCLEGKLMFPTLRRNHLPLSPEQKHLLNFIALRYSSTEKKSKFVTNICSISNEFKGFKKVFSQLRNGLHLSAFEIKCFDVCVKFG